MRENFIEKYNHYIALLILVIFVLVFVGFHFFSNVDNIINDNLYYLKDHNQKVYVFLITENTLQKLGGWPLDRKYYANFVNNVNASVIAFDISFFDKKPEDIYFKDLNKTIVLASEIINNKEKKPVFDYISAPVNVFVESDGIVRQHLLENGFAEKICELYLKKECKKSGTYINFYKQNTFSFEDALNNKYDFNNGVVLVGVDVPNLHDYVVTPVKKEMPGVLLQSNILISYLTHGFIHKINPLFYCLFLVLLLFLIVRKTKLIYFGLVAFFLIIFNFIFSLFLFEENILFSFFYPSITVVFAFFTFLFFDFYAQKREKYRIKHLFGKYVSKNVVEFMLQNPSKYANFNITKKEITVLFADIRGFTKMSSGMEPEEVMLLLNTYLDDMTNIIFKHEGTLDKYVGDEVMAVFNSPTDVLNHEEKAVLCAIEMQKHILTVNKKTGKALKYGIGINTGEAVIGSFGSKSRLEFGVLGDAINVGARFCSVAKGGEIVIGEKTYNALSKNLKSKFKLAYYELKGKGKVKAYVYKVV